MKPALAIEYYLLLVTDIADQVIDPAQTINDSVSTSASVVRDLPGSRSLLPGGNWHWRGTGTITLFF
jgi:hypothetical protein